MEENITIESEELENDSENDNIDYTDILQHISDTLDDMVDTTDAENVSVEVDPTNYTIDDLYNIGGFICVLLLLILLLKVFHGIRRNITGM